MTMANYPGGFKDGITIRGIPITITHPGKVYWVSNATTLLPNQKGGSDSNDGSFNAPFSTLAQALSVCTSGRGDIIFIKPGHAETISAAYTISVSGVAIIGLGKGSSRPTFTHSTSTAANFIISGANVTMKNMIFVANFADIAAVVGPTAGGTDFTFEDNYVKASAANLNFLTVLDTSGTANANDGLYVANNLWIEADTATLQLVKQDADIVGLVVKGNVCVLGVKNNTASLVAIATTKAVSAGQITDNRVYRLNTDTATGAILVTTDVSTNTGIIANNYAQHADTAAELLVTASSGFGCFNNYASGVAGASGYLLPAADS